MPKNWREGLDRPVGERFWEKVDLSGDCWLWTGQTDRHGYGRFTIRVDGEWKRRTAHRVCYFLTEGEWPDGMVLHRCGNRSCVRRDHLYVGDNSDNQRDALKDGTHSQASKTECPKGHPYDEENTIIVRWPDGSFKGRFCRACKNIVNREQYLKRKARAT